MARAPVKSLTITPFQMLLDYATVVAAFFIGYLFYHLVFLKWQVGAGVQPFKIYRNLAFGAGILFLVIFERFGLYSRNFGLMNVEEIKRILQSLILGSLILFSISFLFRPLVNIPETPAGLPLETLQSKDIFEQGPLLYSRLILLYSLVTLFFLLSLQRSIINRVLLKMHVRGPGLNRVLIYGAGEVGRLMVRNLFENPRIGMKPVGFIDDDISKIGAESCGITGQKDTAIKVLGNGLQLPELVRSWNIQEVIIAIPSANTKRIYEIINSCVQCKVTFSFVPNLFDMFIQQVHFEEICGIPLLRMKSARRSYIYLAAKRVFDILFSAFCLFLTLPLWPIVGLLIKWDSKGPVLFSQTRVGKDGRLFTIYKFRSLKSDANHYQRSPTETCDPRITRIGRMLRRCSLDELPQFWNVFKGDMSIVGPRPEMPYVVENYTPIQRQRLKTRPGITGIWQVSSARSAEIHENLDYDLYYTENQSFLLDLVIIAKTISTAIRGRGI